VTVLPSTTEINCVVVEVGAGADVVGLSPVVVGAATAELAALLIAVSESGIHLQ
jgi:hypothetical protein